MATGIKDGGPIYPIPEVRHPLTGEGICEGWRGTSLRDAIAIAVLPTIEGTVRTLDRRTLERVAAEDGIATSISVDDYVALRAYKIADAMLKARES